jgi:6-phosphogluconolactonase/glucosamine-6-phosphate isomerase/deaminase
MYFIKTDEITSGEVDLAEQINQHLLADKKVLWIISGGSNIPKTVSIMQLLAQSNLGLLTIILGDERFGSVGHTDSNAQQLENAGFNSGKAKFIPILIDESINHTVKTFNDSFRELAKNSDFIIAQLGIGEDGHISGILAGSPAINSNDFVVSYSGKDFTRITLTAKSFQLVDTAFVFAWGESKQKALKNLRHTIRVDIQPAQLLKTIKNVFVYNDQIGD